jgi:release factor glutamine methyltransferase
MAQPPQPPRTVLDVVRLSTAYLAQHGGDPARLEAELLVGHALGLARLDLYLQHDRPLDAAQLERIRGLLRRRAAGEPVAYICGAREFYGRPFRVTPAVLIPRPETETLVERALAAAAGRAPGLRLADLGTGSGCLACTLAAELPGATVLASDVSREALAVAAENVAALGLGTRVVLVEGGWGDGLLADIDMAVSNPPYVSAAEMETLPREVRYEPRLALDGGPDGLDAYRAIFAEVAARCPDLFWMGVEVDSQRAVVVTDLAGAAWPGAALTVVSDLSGQPRVVEIRP